MFLSNLEVWRTYLRERNHALHSLYRYPTDEGITDNSEIHQDPMKRLRELESISRAVSARAEVVCDFGCGLGRNFETLRNSVSEGALLIGVEPDAQRQQIAARNTQGFQVFSGSIEFIKEAPEICSIDHFLCCQVLGHTPTSVTRDIIATSLARLSVDGIANFCVPFVNATLHDAVEDYFHEVHLQLNPGSSEFRIRLTEDEFDRIVKTGMRRDVLPVRAFAINIPEDIDRASIPLFTDKIPKTFGSFIADSFRSKTTIYSVHTWHEDIPYIGDLSISIQRDV